MGVVTDICTQNLIGQVCIIIIVFLIFLNNYITFLWPYEMRSEEMSKNTSKVDRNIIPRLCVCYSIRKLQINR